MDRVPNSRIREFCGVTKGGENENDGIAKRFHVGEDAGSPSVGRGRKRWIDTVK